MKEHLFSVTVLLFDTITKLHCYCVLIATPGNASVKRKEVPRYMGFFVTVL